MEIKCSIGWSHLVHSSTAIICHINSIEFSKLLALIFWLPHFSFFPFFSLHTVMYFMHSFHSKFILFSVRDYLTRFSSFCLHLPKCLSLPFSKTIPSKEKKTQQQRNRFVQAIYIYHESDLMNTSIKWSTISIVCWGQMKRQRHWLCGCVHAFVAQFFVLLHTQCYINPYNMSQSWRECFLIKPFTWFCWPFFYRFWFAFRIKIKYDESYWK